jgi:hypothetical protein
MRATWLERLYLGNSEVILTSDGNPGRVCSMSPEPLLRLHTYQELDEANGLFQVVVGGNARITGSTPARPPHWLTRIASAGIRKDNHRV